MPRLTRRTFCASLALATVPIRGHAQATPDATPIDILIGLDDTRSRTFVIQELKPSPSSLVRLEAHVFHFQSPMEVDWAMSSLVAGVILDRPTHEQDRVQETKIAIGPVGAEVGATVIVVDDPDLKDVDVCGVVTQQESWVQILVGYSGGDIQSRIIEMATTLIDRWPSDDLADALPTLDDLPPGMTEVDA